MKTISSLKQRILSFIAFIFITVFINGNLYAQETDTDSDQTISPYFYVMCSDSTIEELPLKSTKVDVSISGVIADVTIQQEYSNGGLTPIEAKYIFPASTKSAVYHLKMVIGTRSITAVVKEKEEAQQEYEEAIEQGQTATLLEQERSNVLQMKVGNIMPGDTIKIILKYTELITPLEGIYEFIYPTVVGPRYFSQAHSDPNDSSWVEIPYTHEGEPPLSTFDINVIINGGMTVSAINSPSHENLEISYISENKAECGLPAEDSLSGNKDFVLDYILSGDENMAGMLTYMGEGENFFLSMIQPPVNPSEDQINQREFIFILDVSGSMSGFPIETSKTLVKGIIQDLKVTEKFNILCFAGGSNFLFDVSQQATQENINTAVVFIESLSGGGGTELLPALEKALAYPTDENYSRIFLIATDGYVSVEKEAFDLIRNNLNNANFFAFGIGSSVNRYIIEGIAHAGMGEPFIVLNSDQAEEKAALFRKYVESPVLTNIEAAFNNIDTFDVDPTTIPDVFAERPVLIFGKWNEPLQGSLTLNGINGNGSLFSKTLSFANYQPSEDNKALQYLWARNRLQIISDYNSAMGNEEYKDEIIQLGLKYNLLTDYTSFIAVDSVIRNENGELQTVVVPNPMPEGVSDNAIGDYYAGYVTENNLVCKKESDTKIQLAYPNPFSDRITLMIYLESNDLEASKTFDIFNSSGRKIKSVDVSYMNLHVNSYSFNGNEFNSKGIYFIQFRLNGEVAGSCKVIKY